MTTPKRAAKCVTHHKACDCREYQFKELIDYGKASITHACYRCKNNIFGEIMVPKKCDTCGVEVFFKKVKEFDA